MLFTLKYRNISLHKYRTISIVYINKYFIGSLLNTLCITQTSRAVLVYVDRPIANNRRTHNPMLFPRYNRGNRLLNSKRRPRESLSFPRRASNMKMIAFLSGARAKDTSCARMQRGKADLFRTGRAWDPRSDLHRAASSIARKVSTVEGVKWCQKGREGRQSA